MQLSHKQFEAILAAAIDAVPPPYNSRLDNVAFILEDEPTPQQRQQLNLYAGETLFGLYEGVPLPQRGGTTKLLPDKITIFTKPLLAASRDQQALEANINHTVWHEVAHYFGLDHARIHEIESKANNNYQR